jgi:transcriptional adapter 2-alpha
VEVYASSLKSTSSSSRNTDPSKVVLDISKAPSAELLSEKELELCCEIPMLPLHYLAAKDAIVREAFRNGILTKEGVHRVLKLDSGKIDTFFDFFVREMTVTEDIVSYSRQMKKKKTEDDEK